MVKFRWWVARWEKKKPCNKAWKVSCCIARRKIWIYIWPEFWCDARFVCTRTRISTKERRYYAIYIFGQLGIGPVHVMKDIKLIIMIRLWFMYRNCFFFIILSSILKKWILTIVWTSAYCAFEVIQYEFIAVFLETIGLNYKIDLKMK